MNKAKRDFATPMIENRASCAYYMGNDSIKLRYLSHILLKTVDEKKKRLLVLQNGPWSNWGGVDEMVTDQAHQISSMRQHFCKYRVENPIQASYLHIEYQCHGGQGKPAKTR